MVEVPGSLLQVLEAGRLKSWLCIMFSTHSTHHPVDLVHSLAKGRGLEASRVQRLEDAI
jgi:hypothetical protein